MERHIRCNGDLYGFLNAIDDGNRKNSEAVIVKGSISLLLVVLSGHFPDEIIAATLVLIRKTKLIASPLKRIYIHGQSDKKLCPGL